MLESNSLLLLLNITLWVITLIWYLKSFKYFGAGALLIFSFSFYALCSYPIYFDSTWNSKFKDLTLFPIIVHYVLIIITFIPIFKWDKMKVKEIIVHKHFIIEIICWFFVLCTMLRIGDVNNLYDGVVKMVISPDAGYDVYVETMQNSQSESGLNIIKNVYAIFSNLLYGICSLMFFYLLSKENKNIKLLLCMVISFILPILIQISISQRGPALNYLLMIIGSYFIYKRFLADKIVKLVNQIILIIVGTLAIPILYITFARFQDRGMLMSLCSYFGQQNIYFNNYAFNNNGLRYGDRIFPMFKNLLGFENVPSDFWERRFKYPYLYINDEVFIGYIGDFFLDFGPIVATVILIFYSIFCLNKLKISNGEIYFYQLLPLSFLMHVCLFGGMFLFPYADKGNLTIVIYVLMYLFLKLYK